MVARSRDSGMECFRPVVIDSRAFKNLTTTDDGKASFWFVDNPAMNLSRGRPLDHAQLAALLREGEEQPVANQVKIYLGRERTSCNASLALQ